MSDINQLLSLLKGHNLVLPEAATSSSSSATPLPTNFTSAAMSTPQTQSQTSNLPQPISAELSGNIPMNIDFSSIRQDVINQVRAEYLQKEEEKVLKNATSVTPEVLVKLGSLVKETNLLQVLKDCKRRQDRKEKELFAQRQAIEAKFKKQKDAILTKEMLGVKVDPSELKKLEKEKDKKLHIMDLLVLKEMDKEVKYLQQEFVNLEVPLFRVTQDPKQLKLQQKILNMLQDML